MKDGGIGINTDFSRFTFHGNTSFKITKSLTAGTTFDYSETCLCLFRPSRKNPDYLSI